MALVRSKVLRVCELGTLKMLSASPKAATLPFVKSKSNSLLNQLTTIKAEHQSMTETSLVSLLPQIIKRQQQDQSASERSRPTSVSSHMPSGVLGQLPWTITSNLQIYPEDKDLYSSKQDRIRQIQVKDFWI